MKPAGSSRRRKMTTTTTAAARACVLAVLCATFVKVSAARQIYIDIEPKKETAVRVGESLQVLCKAQQKITFCRVEIPGEGSFVLTDTQSSENGIEYYGNGFKNGDCGVRIVRVKEENNGVLKCSVTTPDISKESVASVKVIVAKPPNNPDLRTSSNGGWNGRNVFKTGEKMEISCSAPSGRPAANISLFLDDEPLGNDDRTTVYDSIDENSVAMQNASHIVDWKDNGKILRCVASHIALDKPKETTMQLDVRFAPQPIEKFERFGYVIGKQGVINITINANPRPSFTWQVDQETIQEGRPDESNRLETSTAVDLGRGAWSVILTIDSVQKSDTEKHYSLKASNVEGSSEYKIILSTSPEPAGFDLDAGSIIGIVIGVLVLVLIIFLIIFARATGRWCFAARRRGDEETAGDAGAGSEAHITPGDEDDEDHEEPHIIDEKVPQGGQENPIHASTEYVNGRTDIKKDEKTDTPV